MISRRKFFAHILGKAAQAVPGVNLKGLSDFFEHSEKGNDVEEAGLAILDLKLKRENCVLEHLRSDRDCPTSNCEHKKSQ